MAERNQTLPPGATGELTNYSPSWRDQLADLMGAAANKISGKPYPEARRDSMTLMGLAPGTGTVMSAEDAVSAAKQGDWKGAALAGLGAIPEIGPEARALATGGRDTLAGIRAFHGSPHSFDQFDLSKIGTGEGAQAYGHGLYFAENEGIAKSYRDTLSQRTPDGYSNAHFNARQQVQRFGNDPEWAAEIIGDQMRATGPSSPDYQKLADTLEFIKSGKYKQPLQDPGHMYEVNLNADPEHFLDYDKPMSEQPGPVRERVGQLGIDTAPPTHDMDELRRRAHGITERVVSPPTIASWVRNDMDALRGQIDAAQTPAELAKSFQSMGTDYGFYPLSAPNPAAPSKIHSREMQDQILGEIRGLRAAASPPQSGAAMLGDLEQRFGGKKEASARLNEAGVPGIKYFDAGSRAAGDGSRNYVVFDPKIIEIVKKYGIAGALGAGLISQGVASQMQQQTGGDHAL